MRRALILIFATCCLCGAAEDEFAKRERDRWMSQHTAVVDAPDLTLPAEEVDMLPDELVGTWWMIDHNYQIATVTKRSTEGVAHDGRQDLMRPTPFEKILKYKTTDGSIMVRVSFPSHPNRGHDEIYRYVPKGGVAVNHFDIGNKTLGRVSYLSIR